MPVESGRLPQEFLVSAYLYFLTKCISEMFLQIQDEVLRAWLMAVKVLC